MLQQTLREKGLELLHCLHIHYSPQLGMTAEGSGDTNVDTYSPWDSQWQWKIMRGDSTTPTELWVAVYMNLSDEELYNSR